MYPEQLSSGGPRAPKLMLTCNTNSPKAGLGLPVQRSASHPMSPQPVGGYEHISVPQFLQPLKKTPAGCDAAVPVEGRDKRSCSTSEPADTNGGTDGHPSKDTGYSVADPEALSGCTLYHLHNLRHAASPQISRKLHGPKGLCLEFYKYTQKIR